MDSNKTVRTVLVVKLLVAELLRGDLETAVSAVKVESKEVKEMRKIREIFGKRDS